MTAREQLERLGASLLALGARRLAALAAVGMTIFAGIGVGSYYMSRPEFEVLYVGLNPTDVARIGSVLREAGILFDVNAEGTKVFVRHGETATARMLLAEKGLPNSAGAGYELFDKLGSMSLTSFMQNITRVRALEGEIARTIQAMKDVKAARVHIVLPDPGSFRRTPQPPSASVVIRTEGPNFGSAQAIRHLVSAAVPGMTPDQVSVVSTDGRVLMEGGDTATTAAPGKMLDLEKQVSKELGDNIRKTLTPFLGLDNFEVSVTPRLNLDKRQTNATTFNPESATTRSVHTIKETGNSTNSNNKWNVTVEQNVPGDGQNAGKGDQSTKSSERKEETSNFEVDSTVTATVSEGYKIENMAIAVVVNRKRLLASTDKPTPEAVDNQIKEIEKLVQSAAAFDAKRGDKITVAAVDFFQAGQNLEPIPGVGIMDRLLGQSGSLINAIALLAATIMLVWFGLKPAIRAILENREIQQAALAAAQAEASPQILGVSGAAPIIAGPGAVPGMTLDPAMALATEQTSAAIAAVKAQGAHDEQKAEFMHLLAKRNNSSKNTVKQLEDVIGFNEEQAASIIKEWIRGGV